MSYTVKLSCDGNDFPGDVFLRTFPQPHHTLAQSSPEGSKYHTVENPFRLMMWCSWSVIAFPRRRRILEAFSASFGLEWKFIGLLLCQRNWIMLCVVYINPYNWKLFSNLLMLLLLLLSQLCLWMRNSAENNVVKSHSKAPALNYTRKVYSERGSRLICGSAIAWKGKSHNAQLRTLITSRSHIFIVRRWVLLLVGRDDGYAAKQETQGKH